MNAWVWCTRIKLRPRAKEFINVLFGLTTHTVQIQTAEQLLLLEASSRIQSALFFALPEISLVCLVAERIRCRSSIDWPRGQVMFDAIVSSQRRFHLHVNATVCAVAHYFANVAQHQSRENGVRWTWCLLHYSCCGCKRTDHSRLRHEQIQLFNKRTVIIIITLWYSIPCHLCVAHTSSLLFSCLLFRCNRERCAWQTLNAVHFRFIIQR